MAAADGGGGDTASSEPWEPLSSVDFGILGFVATFQAAALLVCVHLLWWRKWPPYVTKNVNLVVIAVSVSTSLTAAARYGVLSWRWTSVAELWERGWRGGGVAVCNVADVGAVGLVTPVGRKSEE